jgi:hypothetical protein
MAQVSCILFLVVSFAVLDTSHSARVRKGAKAKDQNEDSAKDDTIIEDASITDEADMDTSIEDAGDDAEPWNGGPRQAYNYGGSYDYGPGGPRKFGKAYNPGLVDARGNKLSDIDWEKVWANLPSERTDDAYKARSKIWNKIDNNGNGILSLAEIDRGIRDILQLDSVFNCKPAIMRAFQAAKQVNGKTSGMSGDYVERNEFRALLEYLRKYFELYVMYRHIDTNFDGRVSLGEFKEALPKLQEWGVEIDDADEAFELIDIDGGGMILFDEFAAWAIPQTLSLGEDGPGGAGLESADGPSNANLVDRKKPDVAPAVSLSLNGGDASAKARLIKYYKYYAPEKVSDVDRLLRKYRGKEKHLFRALYAKYGPEPGQDGNNFDDI